MHSNVGQSPPHHRRNTDDQRGVREDRPDAPAAPEGISGVRTMKTAASDASRAPNNPQEQASTTDAKDQRRTQQTKSGRKKNAAKQRQKLHKARSDAGPPSADTSRNLRSPQLMSPSFAANKGAADPLLSSDPSSPPEAPGSTGTIVASPHQVTGNVRSPNALRPTPTSSSKVTAAAGKIAVPSEPPAAKTSPGAAENVTAAPLSSEENESPEKQEEGRGAGTGNDVVSPPTPVPAEALGEAARIAKSIAKGAVRRVSIWGRDSKKDGDSDQDAGKAVKKRRQSRNSLAEDPGTSRTTRSTLASTFGRVARKMSSRSTALDISARSLLEEKSTLFMVSVASMAIICSVVAAVLLLLVSRSDPASKVACRSPKCLQFMEQLHSLVNTNKDPCLDFYGYVCGHWLDNGGSFFGDNVNAALVSLARAMHGSNPEQADDREGSSVMLRVYQTCQAYVAGEWMLGATLAEADKQLSLSALRRASTFSDVARLFLKTTLETGLESVVIVGVVRYGHDALLHLSSGRSMIATFQRFHQRGDFNSLVLAVLKTFPELRNDTNTMEELLDMDFNVALAVDVNEEESEANVSFAELFKDVVKGVGVDEWLEYFNEFLLPVRQLNDSSNVVLTTGFDQIQKSLSAITSYGVPEAALYLSTYLSMHIAWTESVRRQVRSDQRRSEIFCLNLTRNVLSQSWPQLIAKLVPVPQESAAVVEAVFETVKMASAGLGVYTWIGHKGRTAIVEAIGSTSLAARLPFEEGVDYSGLYTDEANDTADGKSSL
ncbi:hypothetical protein MTO96_029498 [Rhipicephalus appendiculatus]